MSEQELVENETAELEAALSDEPVKEPEQEQQPEKPAQDRDENGRFKAKEAEERPQVADLPTSAEVEKEKPSDAVPVWRLNEVSAARREATARAEAAERRAQDFERQLQELQRVQQPKEPEQAPDMYQDPEGWQRYVIQQAEQRAQAQADALVTRKFIERDLMRAKEQHGELFDKAYAALEAELAAGNRSTQLRVLNSVSPGEELVKWYRSTEFLKEVGDPEAWRTKEREAMRAQILEEMKTGASDRPKVKIPPSLSKATAYGGGDDAPPMTDRELHASIFQ